MWMYNCYFWYIIYKYKNEIYIYLEETAHQVAVYKDKSKVIFYISVLQCNVTKVCLRKDESACMLLCNIPYVCDMYVSHQRS